MNNFGLTEAEEANARIRFGTLGNITVYNEDGTVDEVIDSESEYEKLLAYKKIIDQNSSK